VKHYTGYLSEKGTSRDLFRVDLEQFSILRFKRSLPTRSVEPQAENIKRALSILACQSNKLAHLPELSGNNATYKFIIISGFNINGTNRSASEHLDFSRTNVDHHQTSWATP